MSLLQSPNWPVLIDIYFFLGGLAGGAFVIATVAHLFGGSRYRDVSRVGYYLALLALIPCPVILIVDLGVPSRFTNMLLHFNPTSPMSMGSWALGGFGVCAALAALFTFLEDPHPGRSLAAGPKTVVGVLGACFGFFLAAYPGVLLGATARPMWVNAHALGALFLAVGASSAAALIALILAPMGRAAADAVARLRVLTVMALIVQLASVAVFIMMVQGSGSPASLEALSVLTSGRWSGMFWGGAIAVGSVVPLLLALVAMKRSSLGLTALVSLLVLAGGFLVKYTIMQAGQV